MPPAVERSGPCPYAGVRREVPGKVALVVLDLRRCTKALAR